MLHFKFDYERCLRSKGTTVMGKDCRNCVDGCVMNILGIKDNRVTVKPDLLQKECIFCLTCQGGCLVDENVIKIWDDENPGLTPVPVTLKKLAQL